MSLKERIYSVLVVSSAESFHTAMSYLLPETKYGPVHIVPSVSAAKRAKAEYAFDFVIVNAPLPDDMGTAFAIDCCENQETVVLMIVRQELHDEIYDKVYGHGVFVLSKPTSKAMLVTALGWLASARERLRKAEKKTPSLEEKMKEIRTVNRAKWLLIAKLNMDEPQAHHYIERQAMDRCVTKSEVATEIIKTYT